MASTDSAPERPAESRPCPWCSARVEATASNCPSCGAALVESASVSDVAIPGVTVVDPEVELAEQRAAKQLSRAKANAAAGTAAAFGITGLLVHKALETAMKSGDDQVFEPTGERPTPTGILPATYEPAPGILPATYEPAPGAPSGPAAVAPEASDPTAAPPDTSTEGGPVDTTPAAPPAQNPWRDLPPSIEGQIEGTQWDPWLGVPAPDPANPPGPNQLSGQPTPSDPWEVEGGPWFEPAPNDGPSSDGK